MNNTAWTDKHNEFCVKHRLPASARELWQWILETQAGTSAEVEFNLKSFNAWVEKQRGKPHDVKTVKSAAQRLVDCGAFKDLKCDGFKWNWKRWIIMPIEEIVKRIKRRKNSVDTGENPNSDAPNPQSADEEVITTTTFSQGGRDDEDLKQKLDLCHEAGIEYQSKEAGFLRTFSLEQIKKAIAYFLFKRNDIDYPEGWFRKCLEDNYAERYLESLERNQHFGSGLFGFTRPVTSALANVPDVRG